MASVGKKLQERKWIPHNIRCKLSSTYAPKPKTRLHDEPMMHGLSRVHFALRIQVKNLSDSQSHPSHHHAAFTKETTRAMSSIPAYNTRGLGRPRKNLALRSAKHVKSQSERIDGFRERNGVVPKLTREAKFTHTSRSGLLHTAK